MHDRLECCANQKWNMTFIFQDRRSCSVNNFRLSSLISFQHCLSAFLLSKLPNVSTLYPPFCRPVWRFWLSVPVVKVCVSLVRLPLFPHTAQLSVCSTLGSHLASNNEAPPAVTARCLAPTKERETNGISIAVRLHHIATLRWELPSHNFR